MSYNGESAGSGGESPCYNESSVYADFSEDENDGDLDEIRAAYGERYERHRDGDNSYNENYGYSDYESSDDNKVDVEKMKQFVLNFHTGKFDGEIEDGLKSSVSDSDNPPDNAGHGDPPPDWEQRKAAGLCELKEELQDQTQRVRTRRTSADVGVLSFSYDCGPRHGAIEESSLPHDASLDSYWNELSDSIAQHESSKIEGLHFSGIQMTKEIIGLLAACVRGKVRDTICFEWAKVCGEGIKSLSTLLEHNPLLSSLLLSNNPITDLNAAMCLSQSLKAHPEINELTLQSCSLGNNVNVLSAILASDINHMDLAHNEISSPGALIISNYLQTNPPIKSLKLSKNNFNDDDAILFAHALKKNTLLQSLIISENKFTPIGAKSLFLGVFDHSSLNAVSESNHTCALHLFYTSKLNHCLDRINKRFFGAYGYAIGRKTIGRKSKLLIALNGKESLLKCLEDVPVELMPEVLAFIQAEDCPKKLLNMIYSTMRWWNMPSLYSYHHAPSKKRKTIE